MEIGDLEALGDDCVDNHCFFFSFFCHANCHLIHISVVVLLLILGIFFFLILVEIRGGFNVGKESDLVLSGIATEFD